MGAIGIPSWRMLETLGQVEVEVRGCLEDRYKASMFVERYHVNRLGVRSETLVGFSITNNPK